MESIEVPDARKRVVIETVRPEIDGGRFPIKRVLGETVIVEADVFADGHDSLACFLLYRKQDTPEWTAAPMSPLGNDRWRGEFCTNDLGLYTYTIEGWVDPFSTWRKDLVKRIDAGQCTDVDILIGVDLIEQASHRASVDDSGRLSNWADKLRSKASQPATYAQALDENLAALMLRHPDRSFAARYEKDLLVIVDRERAQHGSWYEVFPRSCAAEPGQHGTFADCAARMPDIARMGFDVLYLPPIHPIGDWNRKGKNNSPSAGKDDVGSPWAIGASAGGHKAIDRQLGTLQDFQALIAAARTHGLEVALDLAFQCTPDHPYVREHPEWFRHRPDGTIQYAENPPKKYQDIYPIDFETESWAPLWEELRSVVLYWIEKGVRIFRVDNPHTKPFAFWEWMISSVRAQYPDVIFLAEAFTRPKVMYRLAKAGFSQSYTYFTWRNTKPELTEYFEELTTTEVREYFRPNLWPNTPDILPEYLQVGGRPAFMIRLALAATLGANYGIYGPAFELCENLPRQPGSEEYLDSEKYEIKHRDLNSPWSLREFITRINAIRRENPALHKDWSLHFHGVDNPLLLCYSKATDDLSSVILVVANVDFRHTQSGWLDLDLDRLGLDDKHSYQAHDLLGGGRYLWEGRRNFVQLDPREQPVHVLRLRRKVRTERDFDYYL
jgi:starch synthase (maltosyl-transferring)